MTIFNAINLFKESKCFQVIIIITNKFINESKRTFSRSEFPFRMNGLKNENGANTQKRTSLSLCLLSTNLLLENALAINPEAMEMNFRTCEVHASMAASVMAAINFLMVFFNCAFYCNE
ncbi:hypothetical protein CDAR_242461 [Caerostris darwini]|uniref:Uncharacterized protein n=1 Tax=Caerostris darwini TaxID=1538125 RepID=A0AAV4TPW1_9ARAC|nr:hypothetical protein CDAR_242461 [Caerostris darwini]